jgi:hypothetical protein
VRQIVAAYGCQFKLKRDGDREGRIPKTWRVEGACEFVEARCDRVPTDSPLEGKGRQTKREVRSVGCCVVSESW